MINRKNVKLAPACHTQTSSLLLSIIFHFPFYCFLPSPHVEQPHSGHFVLLIHFFQHLLNAKCNFISTYNVVQAILTWGVFKAITKTFFLYVEIIIR